MKPWGDLRGKNCLNFSSQRANGSISYPPPLRPWYHNRSSQPNYWLEGTQLCIPSKRAMPTTTMQHPSGPSGSGVGGRAPTLNPSTESSGAEVSVKPLTRTQKKNRRRALAKLAQRKCEASNAPEASPSQGSVKITTTELSTPSPSSLAALPKRPLMSPPSSSNRQSVTGGTKMAIIKRNFPLDKIVEKEEMLIQREIVKLTDVIPSTAPLPRISHSELVNGVFVIHCDDDSTVKWLTSAFHENGKVIESTQLMVVKASGLFKPVKVAFKHKDIHTTDPQVLLRRIDRLNPELKAVDWRVLACQPEPQYMRWIFQISLESAAAIKKANYIAYAGLDRGYFKILSEPKWTNLATTSSASVPDKVTGPQHEPEGTVSKTWHGSGAEKPIEEPNRHPRLTNWDSCRQNMELFTRDSRGCLCSTDEFLSEMIPSELATLHSFDNHTIRSLYRKVVQSCDDFPINDICYKKRRALENFAEIHLIDLEGFLG